MKKITAKICVFLLILTMLFQSLVPLITYAQAELTLNDDIKLYQTIEEVMVENGIVLHEGTFIYGEAADDEEFINLQFSDTYFSVSQESLNEVDLTEEELPLFVDVEQIEPEVIQPFNKDQAFYSLYPDEMIRIQLTEDMEYPVHLDELGLEVVYIGNIAYYLNEQDRQIAKDAMDANNPEEIPDPKEDTEDESEENREEEDSSDDLVDEPEKEETEESIETEDENTSAGEEELADEEGSEDTEEQDESPSDKADLNEEPAAVLQNKVSTWKNSSANYFRVEVDNLTVYSKGNTKKLGELTKGQVYPIDANYGNWHQIQFGNTKGYVYKADTSPNDGSSLKNKNNNYKQSKQNFVALQNVTVYDNSSGQLVEFGKINSGERYPIVSGYGKNWSRIIFADRVGYVLNSEVRHEFTGGEKYFTVLVSNLPVYDNRTGSLKQVGSLTKGQSYEIVADYGNWHRIQYNNHYGYVQKSSTEPADGAYIRNKNTSYNHSDRSFTALQNTIVYDNTGGKLKAFGTIHKDQSYYIASDYGNWYRIVFADRVGYVQKSKVRFNFFNTDKYFESRVDYLPVYDNSSGSLVKVGELRKGQTYPRISNYGAAWHKIQFGDGFGYVYTDGTYLSDSSKINNLNTSYKNSKDKIVVKENVEIMDNSSGKLIPFGELEAGTIYPIASDYGNWWRIIYLDRVGYIHKDKVANYGVTETYYNISLEEATNIQRTARPQTDKKYQTYVSKEYIDKDNKVTAATLNVRGGPGSQYWVVGLLYEGNAVEIINEVNGWYEIEYTKYRQWVNASPEDTSYYLNPLNFINDEKQKFQFLDLSKSSDAPASVLNNFLSGKGVLSNQGQAFLDASKAHGVNDIYLVSHAILETGNGNSTLAKGVNYKGVKVYNMYGIGAYDSCPIECGAKMAYDEGWTTPYKAIVGGAKFIGNEYIKGKNSEGRVLNTIYKMRWNPEAMAENRTWGKQYATDIGWAAKQVNTMYQLYQQLEAYTLYLDIPVYRK